MPTFDLTPQQWVHEQEILTLTSKYQAHIEDLERKLRQAAVCLKGMMMMQQAHSSPGPGPGPSPATTFETAEKSTETAAAVPVSNKVVEAIDVADDDEEEEQEEVTLVENNTLAACKLSPPSSLTKHAFLPEIEFEISRQKYQAHIDEMERRLARLEIERNHAFTGWRLASVKVQELQDEMDFVERRCGQAVLDHHLTLSYLHQSQHHQQQLLLNSPQLSSSKGVGKLFLETPPLISLAAINGSEEEKALTSFPISAPLSPLICPLPPKSASSLLSLASSPSFLCCLPSPYSAVSSVSSSQLHQDLLVLSSPNIITTSTTTTTATCTTAAGTNSESNYHFDTRIHQQLVLENHYLASFNPPEQFNQVTALLHQIAIKETESEMSSHLLASYQADVAELRKQLAGYKAREAGAALSLQEEISTSPTTTAPLHPPPPPPHPASLSSKRRASELAVALAQEQAQARELEKLVQSREVEVDQMVLDLHYYLSREYEQVYRRQVLGDFMNTTITTNSIAESLSPSSMTSTSSTNNNIAIIPRTTSKSSSDSSPASATSFPLHVPSPASATSSSTSSSPMTDAKLNALKVRAKRADSLERQLRDVEARLKARDVYLQNTIMETARRVAELEYKLFEQQGTNEELEREIVYLREDKMSLERELEVLDGDNMILSSAVSLNRAALAHTFSPSATHMSGLDHDYNGGITTASAGGGMSILPSGGGGDDISGVDDEFVILRDIDVQTSPIRSTSEGTSPLSNNNNSHISYSSHCSSNTATTTTDSAAQTYTDMLAIDKTEQHILSVISRLTYAQVINSTHEETISLLEENLVRSESEKGKLVGQNWELGLKVEQLTEGQRKRDVVVDELKRKVDGLEMERTGHHLKQTVSRSSSQLDLKAAASGGGDDESRVGCVQQVVIEPFVMAGATLVRNAITSTVAMSQNNHHNVLTRSPLSGSRELPPPPPPPAVARLSVNTTQQQPHVYNAQQQHQHQRSSSLHSSSSTSSLSHRNSGIIYPIQLNSSSSNSGAISPGGGASSPKYDFLQKQPSSPRYSSSLVMGSTPEQLRLMDTGNNNSQQQQQQQLRRSASSISSTGSSSININSNSGSSKRKSVIITTTSSSPVTVMTGDAPPVSGNDELRRNRLSMHMMMMQQQQPQSGNNVNNGGSPNSVANILPWEFQ